MLSEANLMSAIDRFKREDKSQKKALKQEEKRVKNTKAHGVTACRRCRSWASWIDGQYRIVAQPPIVVHMIFMRCMASLR